MQTSCLVRPKPLALHAQALAVAFAGALTMRDTAGMSDKAHEVAKSWGFKGWVACLLLSRT